MSSGKLVAAVLNKLLDGLEDITKKHVASEALSRHALITLCEAMWMSPQPMKTHIAKRLLDLEVNSGIETPMKYRLELADAVQGIPTMLDHVEPFRFSVVKGGGEDTEETTEDNDQPRPKLRVVKENGE